MTPHRGLIGARKKRLNDYTILRKVRDMLHTETFQDVLSQLALVVKERDIYKERFGAISAEFSKKKIGANLKIRKKGKDSGTKKAGVLYFNKQHIGKRVIVWEKK